MRLGIVNDMDTAIEAIRRVVVGTGKHEIAWTARDGAEAVERCAQDTPDIVLMDLIMPKMNGVEATRRIMAQSPCAVLVVTATVEGHAGKVFEAMGAGALDAVQTPSFARFGRPDGAAALVAKIGMIGQLVGERNAKPVAYASGDTGTFTRQSRLVAIGSSAGGPGALAKVLADLPSDFGAAIIIVQHVDAQFAQGLANWLNENSKLPVRVATPGDRPQEGTVLLAGTNDHLVFETPGRLGYVAEPAQLAYRPSVDVFFESVARHWRGEVIGVLLTGMGRDGAKGLKTLRRFGHHTIAQDQATCAVYGMPKAAAELEAAVDVLPLDKIALALLNRFTKTPRPLLKNS